MYFRKYYLSILVILISISASAQDSLSFSTTEIIYGRKDGMALTMMKLTALQKSNGKAIIHVLSGNWVSSERMMARFPGIARLYIENGYTVFGVMVGC